MRGQGYIYKEDLPSSFRRLLSTLFPKASYQLSSQGHQNLPLRSPPKTTKSPIKTLPQIKLSLYKRKAYKIKTFSSKREERRLKIPSEKTKHINVPSTSKINTSSQDLLFQQEGNISISQEERTSTQVCFRPKGSNFHIKTFSFNEKETSDGPRRREQAPRVCFKP